MKEAVVNANKISVRAKRTKDSEQLGTLSRDDVVAVLDGALDQDYAMVIWKVGYAYSLTGKYIRMVSSDAEPPETNAVVTANLISVREGRGFINARLGYFHKDDEITVLDPALDQTYAKVVWQLGYAYSAKGEYLRFLPNISEPNAVVTANAINVRQARSSDSKKLGTLKNDSKIIVYDPALDQDYAMIDWERGIAYAYSAKGRYVRFLADIEIPSESNAVVTGDRISVRSGRGSNYTKLGEFVKGDPIIVLDDTLNYEYVHVVWNDADGYAYCDFGNYIALTLEEQGEICCRDMEPNAVVTASAISVREGRGANYKKLGELKKGDAIIVGDVTLDYEYALVKWIDRKAYAYSNYGMYIRFTDKPLCDCITNALNIAKTCVGGKYIFGAQGTKITEKYVRARQQTYPSYFTNGRFEYLLDIGQRCDAAGAWKFPDDYAWDCSGLWWYCANKAGIYGKNLDTTAHTYYHSYCVPIAKADLIPGDAVFYENSSGRITHMAFVGEGGVVYEAMSGYTGVVMGESVNDRTAPKIVGSGNLKRSAWNRFGRPKIFISE